MEETFSDVPHLENSQDMKVHRSACEELANILSSVRGLIPAMELARPGCSSGIQELCLLNRSIAKGTRLVDLCAKSSKLYSVITRQATVSRCERISADITKSLHVLHSMVQEPLATKILNSLAVISNTKFCIDSNEEEAGQVLLSLLRNANVDEDSEFEAFQKAASRLKLTSSKAQLLEKRCIRNHVDDIRGAESADVKKERILIYLLSLLTKHGKAVLDAFQCEDNLTGVVNNSATSKPNTNGSQRTIKLTKKEGEFSQNKNQSGKLLQYDRAQGNKNQPESSTQHMPPNEFLCPLSSQIMFDPVSITSGETYERIWIEKWFREGNDTCPRTHQKLSDRSTVPNYSLKNLILQWCQRRGITVQDPSFQPVPVVFCSSDIPSSTSIRTGSYISEAPSSLRFPTAFHATDVPSFSSISSLPYVSSVLLYNKTANCNFEKGEDMTTISDDASFCSNSATVGGFDNCYQYGKKAESRFRKDRDRQSISTDASLCSTSAVMGGFHKLTEVCDQMFAWSAMYQKHKSFDRFDYSSFYKFLSDLSDLPPSNCQQSLGNIKHIIGSDSDTLTMMLSNGFKEALIKFVGYAFESCNVRAQEAGLEILSALLSNIRHDLPALDDDASFLLAQFLRSGLTLESLSLIRIMCRYIDCIPSIVDSGVSSSILKIIDSGHSQLVALAVEILSELSSISDIRYQILSHGRLANLVPLLGDKKLAKSCLKIFLNLCNAAECTAVAQTDGCIALVAELLETGTRDEQADAVAILLSLCAVVPDYSQLIMREGVIPALVSISVTGSQKGKEDSKKLLHLLRELSKNETFQRSTLSSSPRRSPLSLNKSPVEKQSTSKSYDFFKRKLMFFSKPKSVPAV